MKILSKNFVFCGACLRLGSLLFYISTKFIRIKMNRFLIIMFAAKKLSENMSLEKF